MNTLQEANRRELEGVITYKLDFSMDSVQTAGPVLDDSSCAGRLSLAS